MTAARASHSLPRLPIPPLGDTCARYLKAVAPFLGLAELARTARAVDEFLDGCGPRLQTLLERWDAGLATSYVHDVWEDAYLEDRRPLPIYQNAAGTTDGAPDAARAGRARWIAALLVGAAEFCLRTRHGLLVPDRFGTAVGCMAQYPYLFGTARRPGLKRDTIAHCPRAPHVAIAWNGAIYILDVIRNENPVPLDDLHAEIEWIVGQPAAPEPDISILTSLPRAEWAIQRAFLENLDPANAENLDLVDGALLLVCLDDFEPTAPEAVAKNALHGVSHRSVRWFDKSVQVIVTESGRIALNLEHSRIDGLPSIRFTGEMISRATDLAVVPPKAPAAARHRARALRWVLGRPIEEAIRDAEDRASTLYASLHNRALDLDDFRAAELSLDGRGTDALFHLAVQLAYQRRHGRPASVYESAHTRHFAYGRTETMRPATDEALRCVAAFLAGRRPLRPLLEEAVCAHAEWTERCKQGLGIDRHLLALTVLSRGQGIDAAMFADPAFAAVLHHTEITSSSLPAVPYLERHAFGPAVPDGYGISYVIGPDRLRLHLTTQTARLDPFAEALVDALRDVRRALRED